MLLTTPYNLARAIIAHIIGAEDGFGILGTMRSKTLEVTEETACYLLEPKFGINLYDWRCMFGQYVL